MRKSEFIAAVAKEVGMSQRDVEKVVDSLTPVIVKTCIEDDDEISLPFGKFRRKVNPAKTGTNPLTQKPMNVPESHTLAFKASKTIKVTIEPKKAGKKK